MDLKEIKKILDMIAESEVNQVTIEEGDFKIKVKKTPDVTQSTAPQPVQYQVPAGQQAPQQPAQQAAAAPSQKASEGGQSQEDSSPAEADGQVVKSPIVGTFYRAPNPDSDPFVNVGDQVEKGQTLCIVEAMKIMNEIESEFSGEVKKILVENSEAVEFEQPLFIIG